MTKNSFVLQTRLNDVVAKLSDKQAGVLFKGILNYAANGTAVNFEDSAVTIAFEFVRQDIDYTAKRYAETCAKRAESGRLGGRPKKANESKKSKCFFEKANESKRKHNDNEYEYDNDINKNILTAPKSAGCTQDKPKRELNDLQKFSNAVIENFEAEVKTPDQKSVWFKRNCRCLRDILKFCGGDIPLAVETIDCCLIRLEKAGLSGGYEAVLRNIPDYYAEAKKKLGGAYA
jgi:hypothetical protein